MRLSRIAIAIPFLVAANALADPPAPDPGETNPPLAGYAGSFFLRDPNDWFVLFPKGRLQIDDYTFLNRGDPPPDAKGGANSSSDARPKDTAFIRRARVELQGTFAGHFDFHIAGEFASIPGAGQYGTAADTYVIVDYLPWLKFQAGQFDAPFTLENRTSDKYFDFMERSIAVRAFGIPLNKDDGAMIWGWIPKSIGYYSLGLFNGDGQNFKNQDNHPLVLGRAFVTPLAFMATKDTEWMKYVWLGGSIWSQTAVNLGSVAAAGTTQDDIAAVTTQGGFSLFSSSYGNGSGVRSHLAPDGDTLKWALELNVPVKKYGARLELVHQSIELSQYNDVTSATTGAVARSKVAPGTLGGIAYYAEVYYWILGDSLYIEQGGIEPMPRLKVPFVVAKQPDWGLQVAARYQHADFTISGLAKTDPASGDYSVDSGELAVTAWHTKHVRLTADYNVNYIGGNLDHPSTNITKNIFYHSYEHELLFRVGIAL